MKTFKQYLKETNYGSLVDPDKYREMDKADKALYKYTADAFTSVSHVIDTLIKRYPYKGGDLYRGLHFSSQEQHDKFLESIEDGTVKIDAPSSWTPHKGTAQDFAHSKKSYFPTPELMYASEKMRNTGDHMTGYGGVVLMTSVGEGEGVDVSQTGYQKESEVILRPGTYKVAIAELVEPYSRKFDTPEKVQTILDMLKKAKGPDDRLNKLAHYVRVSWMKKLSEPQADILMKYQSYRFLTMPTSELQTAAVVFKIDQNFFEKDSQRLEVNVYPGVDEELYHLCSDKMQAVIDKRIKLIVKALADQMQQLAEHPKVDQLDEFRIYGIKALMKFFPAETTAAIKPLRKVLADRYHFMNSREVSKTLKTQDWQCSQSNVGPIRSTTHERRSRATHQRVRARSEKPYAACS
jgi:hypothetical protein